MVNGLGYTTPAAEANFKQASEESTGQEANVEGTIGVQVEFGLVLAYGSRIYQVRLLRVQHG